MNTKQEMRKYYLEKRRQLSQNNVRMLGKFISDKVLILSEIKKAKSIAVYLPINNEVDTKDLINGLLNNEKMVAVCCYFDDGGYHFARFYNWQNLEAGPYGVLQPTEKSIVDPKDLDMAIVPGVAFNKNGVRLGYGKGVFDKLLSGCSAFKIGLAYDFQIVDHLPKESHDLVIDLVISEKRSFSCLTTSQ